MKGIDRVFAIDTSTPRMVKRVPEAPNQIICLLRLLRAANQALTTYLDLLLRPIGFSESTLHSLILLFASEHEMATPGMLCELVGQSKANMTRILEMLSSRQYISRHDDELDGRRQVIRITPQGRELVQTLVPALSGPLSMSVAGLDAPELAALDSLLRKLVQCLDSGERRLRATA